MIEIAFTIYLSYCCVRLSKGSKYCANFLHGSCTAFDADTNQYEFIFIIFSLGPYIQSIYEPVATAIEKLNKGLQFFQREVWENQTGFIAKQMSHQR